ncbi:MAG: hypothetical protein IJF27_05115 [Oscillospiraceae bacterium]|nr:hypothetical protein [Oscillospiraceae bacterium]
MKKFVAMLVALACILSLTVVAFADVISPAQILIRGLEAVLPFLIGAVVLVAAAVVLCVIIIKRKKTSKNEDK